MIQIRNSIFETNSSSTHAVCVYRVTDNEYMHSIPVKFYLQSNFMFGRCESDIRETTLDKLAYAYIVANDLTSWKRNNTGKTLEDFKNNVFEVCEEFYYEANDEENLYYDFSKEDVENLFQELDKKIMKFDAYVDHTEDFMSNGFFEKIMNDKDFLKRYLFDDRSYLTCGGDEFRGYNIKTLGFQCDYPEEMDCYYDFTVEKDYYNPRDYYIGEFWNKLKEYEKEFEVFLKGN